MDESNRSFGRLLSGINYVSLDELSILICNWYAAIVTYSKLMAFLTADSFCYYRVEKYQIYLEITVHTTCDTGQVHMLPVATVVPSIPNKFKVGINSCSKLYSCTMYTQPIVTPFDHVI